MRVVPALFVSVVAPKPQMAILFFFVNMCEQLQSQWQPPSSNPQSCWRPALKAAINHEIFTEISIRYELSHNWECKPWHVEVHVRSSQFPVPCSLFARGPLGLFLGVVALSLRVRLHKWSSPAGTGAPQVSATYLLSSHACGSKIIPRICFEAEIKDPLPSSWTAWEGAFRVLESSKLSTDYTSSANCEWNLHNSQCREVRDILKLQRSNEKQSI